jgi:hypothetical protein
MRADDFAADGSDFSDVIFRDGCGDLVGLCCAAVQNATSSRTNEVMREQADFMRFYLLLHGYCWPSNVKTAVEASTILGVVP